MLSRDGNAFLGFFLGLGWFLKSGGKIRFKKLYVDIIMHFFISNKENRSSDHYIVDMCKGSFQKKKVIWVQKNHFFFFV